MAAQTYQISYAPNTSENTLNAVFILASAVLDGVAYGLSWEKCLLDPTGRLRFTLSGPLPQDAYDSYLGSIIVVGGGGG